MTVTSDTPMSSIAAQAQQAEIRRIMADRQLDFGLAINYYIKQRAHLARIGDVGE